MANDPVSPISPPFLTYRDFSDTIVHRDSLTSADTGHSDNIFLKIIHPYDVDAFEHFLSKHRLTYFYSILVPNLRNGFPLGEMPRLTDTVIFKNHPSTLLYSDTVAKYLVDEPLAGRMSGPFPLHHIEKILRGSIFCSPLLVSVQTQQPGTPDKLRVCRHLSKGDKNTPSTNSHIQKEDFPTRFDTASRVADIVRSSPIRWQNTSILFMGSHLVALYICAHISWPYHYRLTSSGHISMGSHLVSHSSWSHISWLYLHWFPSWGLLFHGSHLVTYFYGFRLVA